MALFVVNALMQGPSCGRRDLGREVLLAFVSALQQFAVVAAIVIANVSFDLSAARAHRHRKTLSACALALWLISILCLVVQYVDRVSEAADEAEIRKVLADFMTQQSHLNTSIARRAVHPKHHGCVTAEFEVLQVPEEQKHLQVGVFLNPGTKKKAIMRFSNGASTVEPDADWDIRGAALKILDVRDAFPALAF